MKLGEAVYKAAQEAQKSESGENKPNEDGARDADFSEKEINNGANAPFFQSSEFKSTKCTSKLHTLSSCR